MNFGERLVAHIGERGSHVVLGLDPDPARLWPAAVEALPAGGTPGERAAAAVAAHCGALIDAAGPVCVAAKAQLACFERLGPPGWAALREVLDRAHAAGLLTIADGKRGDVPVTAAAYAQALLGGVQTPFGEIPGLPADAVTASPLLGRDALEPLLDAAREARAGLFVLVRTSNPGAADVQDLPTAEGAPLWERVAALVAELAGPGDGPADIGAVMGATAPDLLSRARSLMPRAPFLIPGVGAQGGRVEDLAPAFGVSPATALVTASRAIERAAEVTGADPAAAARAEAERLRDAAWQLAERAA